MNAAMKMTQLITALTLLLCCRVAEANDGAVEGVGGRWHFMQGEHRKVRLVSETIRLDVYREYYETKVDFVFKNVGGPVTVMMGFPESGGGDIGPAERFRNHSGFMRFASWVDGRRVKAQRVVTHAREEWYEALWLKRVRFRQGQTRHVRVRYRAPHGTVAGEGQSTPYNFTGGNWQATVRQSTLTVVTHLSGPQELGATFNWKRLPLRRRDNRFFFRWSDWQAEGSFAFWSASTLPGWLTIGRDSSFFHKTPENVMMEFPVPHRQQLYEQGVYWSPPAVLRSGMTFINLNAFSHWLRDKANTRRPAYFVVTSDITNVASNTITLRIYNDASPPHEVRHSLRFQMGQANMVLDGKKVLPLPIAPFVVGRFASDLDVYVPLRPILNLVGGWARVDAALHRLYFDAPSYEFWK
jgi:hypothetical protein